MSEYTILDAELYALFVQVHTTLLFIADASVKVNNKVDYFCSVTD